MNRERMRQINVRLNERNFETLSKVSRESGQSPGMMGSNIINQWLELYHCKMCRGDVIFSKPVLRRLMDALDTSQIDDISGFMAEHIIKEIKMQEGDVSYHNLVEHILKWNKANHLPLNKINKKKSSGMPVLIVIIWMNQRCLSRVTCWEGPGLSLNARHMQKHLRA